MNKAALRYSPVQYSEGSDLLSLAPHTARLAGSLRRGEPVTIRSGIDLPIKFLKDASRLSSPKGFEIDLLHTAAVINSDMSLPKPLVLKRLVATEQPRFVILQKWEAIVLTVSSDSFIARLINQTDSGPDQEAEFSTEEIDEPDHPLIQPGAVFYWTLGYSDSPGGQRNRISSLRFRRLPAWNKKDIETAKAEARRLLAEIDCSDPYPA